MKSGKGFDALGIAQDITEKLVLLGITDPTLIQHETIPSVREGKNLIVQAPTGTGKTLAYLAPLITRLDEANKDMEILILAPSRELAIQVTKVARKLAPKSVNIISLIGGANTKRQLDALKEKPKIAVGTPGRILELLKQRKINGQKIRSIVVDETDKMLSGGFFDDVKGVLKGTLKTRQVIFVSASIDEETLKEISHLVEDTVLISTRKTSPVPSTIDHYYLLCGKEQRSSNIKPLLSHFKPAKAIIFLQRNEGVGTLAGRLQDLGVAAVGLHSDLAQPLRKKILEKFRCGHLPVLISTDLLARGMDIEGVDLIINYDLPVDSRHYLHRVGRTGRAGRPGTAITLVPEEKRFILSKYEKTLDISFTLLGINKENKVFPIVYKHHPKKIITERRFNQ